MKKFNINYVTNPSELNRVYFLNHLPGLLLLSLVIVLPNNWIFYPVIVIACMISVAFVFFPFYSNAVLTISNEKLTITKKGVTIVSIDTKSINKVRLQESATRPKSAIVTIAIAGNDQLQFYMHQHLFKGAIRRANEFRDFLLELPSVGRRVFE